MATAGGPGLMATDELIELGGEPARLSNASTALLSHELLSGDGLVQIQRDADAARYAQVAAICASDPEVDGVLVVYVPAYRASSLEAARALTDVAADTNKPILAVWVAAEQAAEARELLAANDIPTYETPEPAVRAYSNMFRYRRNLELLYETPSELPVREGQGSEDARAIVRSATDEGRSRLTEMESRELLAAYGIPVPASFMPFEGERAVIRDMGGNIDYDLVLCSKKDTDFKSVILFGTGGPKAALIDDCSIALPPLNQTLARRLMEETRAYQVIRTGQPDGLRNLEAALVNFSRLIADFPEIAEIEINPLAMKAGRPWRHECDDRARWHLCRGPFPLPPSCHYPVSIEFVSSWSLADGTRIVLRPIRAEDEPLERDFVSTLSEESQRTRFFSTLRNVTHEWLVRYVSIDYDRHIAIVAEIEEEGRRKIIGVARIVIDADFRSGEIAVLVHDRFQGKGVGRRLMEAVIAIGRWKGLHEIRGEVMTDNQRMIGLCKKLGFSTEWLMGGITKIRLGLT